MPRVGTTKFQIGKFGITPGVINSLKLALKNHKSVRISALQASGRDKNSIRAMANSIVSALGGNHKYTIIGFTIILRGRIKT